MNPTYYIHIGYPKTGSTTIQRFLASNKEVLIKNGICYPQEPGMSGWPSHNRMITDANTKKFSLKKQGMLWHRMLKYLKNIKCKKIIISAELFSSFAEIDDIRAIREILQDSNVYIICYIRRYDLWFNSIAMQWLWEAASSRVRTLQDFVEMHDIPPLDMLDRWASVFGQDNIRVVPFEKSSLQPSLIHTFFKCIDEPILPEYVMVPPQNVSPPA